MQVVRLAKRAEFLVGTVTGLSDQGTILFGEKGKVVYAKFFEDNSDNEIEQSIHYPELPSDIKFLVVNSRTPRCLSGAAGIDYAIPRFSNSISLLILQNIREKLKIGKPFERIADIPKQFTSTEILEMIKHIPAEDTIESIKSTFPSLIEKIDMAYDSYFSNIADIQSSGKLKVNIPFRGPILFSISECARAQYFNEILEHVSNIDKNSPERSDMLCQLGELMSIGHAGDRYDGDFLITDEQLLSWSKLKEPIYKISGAFKASTRELDTIQQILVSNGALGACLTGAGLGGCVIAIFHEKLNLENVKKALEEDYFRKENKDEQDSIFEAHSVQGACFI